MVGDTPVAFTDKGLLIGSSPVPADPKPIEEALAAAKIGLEYMPRQDTDTGVVAPTIRVTQRDDSGGSITYVLGRTSAFAQGAGTLEAPPSDDPAGTTDGSGAGGDQASAPPDPHPASAVAAAPFAPDEETVTGIDVPTSFVLPDPAADTSGVSFAPAPVPPAPTVVELASGGGTGAVAGAGRDTRRAAARLLISASNTAPLFTVLALALVSALGTALFLRRLGSRMR